MTGCHVKGKVAEEPLAQGPSPGRAAQALLAAFHY